MLSHQVKQNAKLVMICQKWHDLAVQASRSRGGDVADAVDRLLRSLEDRFETELGSAERAAAFDLALSLMQDQTLRIAAPRGSGLVAQTESGSFEVGFVGDDFVADRACTTFRKLRDVVLVEDENRSAPQELEGSLLDALRATSRRRPEVVIEARSETVVGFIEHVGRDHVVIEQRTKRKLILPAEALRSVRYVRGG